MVGESIPRTSYYTILDQYIVACYLLLFIPAMESIVVVNLDPDVALTVDRIILALHGGSVILMNIVFAIIGQRTIRNRKKRHDRPKDV